MVPFNRLINTYLFFLPAIFSLRTFFKTRDEDRGIQVESVVRYLRRGPDGVH